MSDTLIDFGSDISKNLAVLVYVTPHIFVNGVRYFVKKLGVCSPMNTDHFAFHDPSQYIAFRFRVTARRVSNFRFSQISFATAKKFGGLLRAQFRCHRPST